MARSFTVLQLIDRARQGADKENDEHIPLPEWKSYLSSAYAELYAILVSSGWRYFETEATITTDGTNHSYALPADFLSNIGVDYEYNGSTENRRQLKIIEAQERNIYQTSGGNEAFAYAMVGANIRLYPKPKTGQTYYHIYVPQPTILDSAADGDNVDVVTPDGENFIVWNMAFRALHKEASDTRDAKAEREEARARVYEWAVLRAMNEPKRSINQQTLGNSAYDPGDNWGRGNGGNGNW